MNPYTGEEILTGPALPSVVGNLRWEYPQMGSQAQLMMPVISHGPACVLEFMTFGGSDQMGQEFHLCSTWSLRIALTINPNGQSPRYQWGAWQAEQMPGPRCLADSVLLPNGDILILNGAQVSVNIYINGTCSIKAQVGLGTWLTIPQKTCGLLK